MTRTSSRVEKWLEARKLRSRTSKHPEWSAGVVKGGAKAPGIGPPFFPAGACRAFPVAAWGTAQNTYSGRASRPWPPCCPGALDRLSKWLADGVAVHHPDLGTAPLLGAEQLPQQRASCEAHCPPGAVHSSRSSLATAVVANAPGTALGVADGRVQPWARSSDHLERASFRHRAVQILQHGDRAGSHAGFAPRLGRPMER